MSLDFAVLILFLWLLDLCGDMVKAGHSGDAAITALFVVAGGLVYLNFFRNEDDACCDICADDEFISISRETIEDLLDSVNGVSSGSELSVSRNAFNALKREYNELDED